MKVYIFLIVLGLFFGVAPRVYRVFPVNVNELILKKESEKLDKGIKEITKDAELLYSVTGEQECELLVIKLKALNTSSSNLLSIKNSSLGCSWYSVLALIFLSIGVTGLLLKSSGSRAKCNGVIC